VLINPYKQFAARVVCLSRQSGFLVLSAAAEVGSLRFDRFTMPRSRINIAESNDEQGVAVFEEDIKPKSRRSSAIVDSDSEDGDDDDAVRMFSSQAPEMSQDIRPARDTEKSNLLNLGEEAREKVLTDLLRLCLFKALAGQPINRSDCAKEAGLTDSRISNAAFEEVNIRLRNIFDFELKRIPAWMERMKNIPNRFKDRYYAINVLEDDSDNGAHSKTIHSIHKSAAVEKGLLMVVLALTYCKGEPTNDGSRWILDKDLYHLLHKIDENIHPDPPVPGSKRNRGTENKDGGEGMTPDVDIVLARFVDMDYLIREKATKQLMDVCSNAEDTSFFFCMGPRAVMEIGRRQVIYFCAEILDEEPDPTMLAELEHTEGVEDVPMTA
jgi:hypothetical protein